MANLGKLGAIHYKLCVMIIVSHMCLSTSNITYYFSDPPTKLSKFDYNCIFSAVVITLSVSFVSSANVDIIHVKSSSISLTQIIFFKWDYVLSPVVQR